MRPTCAGMRRSSTGSTRAGHGPESRCPAVRLRKRSTALSTAARHVLGWRTGGHRCRRRGNGAAFSHGLAGRCMGAPGSVRERTGAIISPRVGSREADTTNTDQPHGCPRRPSWRRDERNAAKPRGSARRGNWCWVESSPRPSEPGSTRLPSGGGDRGYANGSRVSLRSPGTTKKRREGVKALEHDARSRPITRRHSAASG